MIVQQINQDSKTILDIPISEDDTIEMIKYKASQTLGCQPHEIYLFAHQLRQMNVHTLYEELMKKTEIIVKEDVEHLLADLLKKPKKQLKAKDYSYDDLLKLLDIQNEDVLTIPIGHILRESANPFLCKKKLEFNSVDYRISNHIPANLQKTLLLDYLPIMDNTLYVVQQANVDKELHSSYFESEASMDDLDVLRIRTEKKENLLSNQEESKIKASFVQSIQFTILPTHKISISLESIFNLLHATEEYPMIHYYTGKSVLYKLYTIQKDINNKKIPFLAKSVVYHVGDKDIKVKSVNVYLDNRNSCVLFYENGSISVHIKKNKAIAEEELNSEIQKIVLPILSMVKEAVYQSGYTYPWNESSNIVDATNIKVEQLEYLLQVNTNILEYKNKLSYVSNVCIDISVNKEEDKFIYLCTSELDMNQLSEQVIKYLMTNFDTKKKIIQKIKTMFQLSDDSADTLFTNYAPSSETVVHQPNINVGFKVTFLSSPPSIIIEGINNIHYLPSIKTNFNCIANFLVKNIQNEKDVVKEKESIVQTVVDDFQELDAFGGARTTVGGAIEDLDQPDTNQYDLKNPNFAVTRLKHKYNLTIPGVDYNKKCLRQFVPIIVSKSEWESEKYKSYRDRLDKMENGDKYVSLQDDHVLLCPKYWSFKKTKAYLDETDFESPRKDNDIFEFHKNSKETRYDLDKHGEYYEYPTYHHDEHILKPSKYPYFMKGNLPCCQGLIHKKKDEKIKDKDKEKPKELTTNQYIVGKVEPIDTEEGTFKYGYLPEPLIDFFDLVHKKVFRKSQDTAPYEMLRWGVPNKQNQFLYTMYAIYKLTQKSITFKSYLQGMKDDFKYIQNGNISNKYLSFNDFIKDSKNITHEEGLELVSRFHKYNIIIFKDNNDSVELVCPSNTYGKQFDERKQSIILYYFEKDNCYEPIIQKPQNKNNVKFEFDMNDLLVQDALQTIKNTYKKCTPIIDYEVEDRYTPQSNITSVEIYNILYDGYEYIQQVTQYNKCVGFVVEEFYIPCYPSEIIREIEEIHTPPIHAIEDTIRFLNHMHDTMNLPCSPIYKVINKKNKISGLLTETFHYVPCSITNNSTKIKLEPYYGNLKHEFIELKHNIEDTTRIVNTNRIKYEQYGYTYCKNQLMIALNLHDYVEYRSSIKKIVNSNKTYQIKLEEVTDIIHNVLRAFLKNKIEWVNDIPEEYIQDMLEQCPNGFCNASKMYLPKINIVTYEKNDYYKRLADELIRNKQIELFVLKPELQFSVPYQANDHELILDGNVIETYLTTLDKPAKIQRYYDNINVLPTDRHTPLVFSCTKLDRIIITE
uniref:Uncharacterized protein n=1 Tax=viral metagenome TaxID=1070528 RepID=A0A6C0B9X0_9ZZZZ